MSDSEKRCRSHHLAWERGSFPAPPPPLPFLCRCRFAMLPASHSAAPQVASASSFGLRANPTIGARAAPVRVLLSHPEGFVEVLWACAYLQELFKIGRYYAFRRQSLRSLFSLQGSDDFLFALPLRRQQSNSTLRSAGSLCLHAISGIRSSAILGCGPLF